MQDQKALTDLSETSVKPLPDVDMISIGPDIKDVHTPAEHLSISSVDRMWRFLKELVISIA